MLKILLISPPIFDFYYTPARKEPLGLLYIKSALDLIDGVKTDIFDTLLSGKVKKMAWPEQFKYLKNIYQKDSSPFSLFSRYLRFGDSFDKIIARINNGNYDIIGISALFSGYYPDVEDLIARIKTETDVTVVAGGWACAEKTDFFSKSRADYFLSGSGEYTFPLFVNAIINNKPIKDVPGIIKKEGNTVYRNPNNPYSSISNEYPKRTEDYFFKRKRIAKVILSKGCLYNCDFCTIHREQKFSIRSFQSIENELEYLLNLGVEIIDFEDDNLFYNKDFSDNFITLLEKYHKKGLSYTAMNGITAKNILPYIDDLIRIGFIEFNMSLVAIDGNVSKSLNRPFNIEVIKNITDKVRGRVKTLVFLILGLPQSSPKKVLKDIIQLAQLPVTIGVSPLYLLPDIPMFINLGLPEDRRLLRGSTLHKFGKAFTREDVASIWKYVRMINFIKEHEGCDYENLLYFCKSIKEKKWYRKNNENQWIEGFSFSLKLPLGLNVCSINNNMLICDFENVTIH